MNIFVKKGLLGLAIFLLAFFIANQILFFEEGLLERYATNISYPFLCAASSISNFIHKCVESKESYEQLKSDLKALHEKYDDVCSENIKIKATISFDTDTKELREFKERYNFDKMLLAKILVKNLKQDNQFFLIDRGKSSGIKKNMIGIYKTQILGKITEVHDYYSKLTLITDESCKVAAYTSSTKAKGIVIGQNKINLCKMHYVSHLLEVDDNDLVFSSGKGLVFPEGFCIGKIVKHLHSHDSIYHDIEIEPLINIKAVKYCLLTDISQTYSVSLECDQAPESLKKEILCVR
jgi:rod shape-determining protein MreC